MLVPTTQKRFNTMVILAYAMVYIVWGSTYFFIHKALSGFEPFMLGAFRFVTAGLLMLGWCHLQGHKIFDWTTIKSAGVTGLLLLFIDTGIIIWVEQFLASGLVAIMAASAAIWFVILDKPRWGENFRSIPIVAGLLLGFAGVIMLFGDQLATSATANERSMNLQGMLLLILGAIAWTGGSLYSKYVNSSDNQAKTNSLVGTSWQIMIAGLAFTVTAGIRGEISAFDYRTVPAEAWWSIAYLVVFGSALAYSSYIWLLKVRPATEVSTYAYVNPIIAVLLSLFLTDETITSTQIIGLVVILLSVFLMNWEAYASRTKNRIKELTRRRALTMKKQVRTRPAYRFLKPRKGNASTLDGMTEGDLPIPGQD